METRTTILLYGFILLTVLLSTELSQNQSNPLKSLESDQTEQNTIPTQQEPSKQKAPLLLTPTHQHPSNHETPHIELNNHRRDQNNKKKMHTLKPFHRFLSTGNPIWVVLFRILKFSFRCIITILYYPLFFLFNFLNHLILWFWDQIVYPMTFPIRLACQIIIFMPIKLVQKILIKLKPLLVFLISGVTMGVFIGIMGSFVHLFLANRLFPVHIQPKKFTITQQQPSRRLDSSKRSSLEYKNHNTRRSKYRQENPKLSMIKNQDRNEERVISKTKETKRKGRKKEPEYSDEISSLEEEELISANEQEWPLEELESHVTDSIESNNVGYSSALQSIMNDRTRKRSPSSHHHPNDTPSSSSSPHSILYNRNSPRRQLSPTSSYTSFSPASNKKKVTFKTD